MTFAFRFCIFAVLFRKTETNLFFVIQTTEGRKDLENIHVNDHEILRRYAPLNDTCVTLKNLNYYGKKRNLFRIPSYQPS